MSDESSRAETLAQMRHEIAHPRPSVSAALATLTVPEGGRVLDAGCGPGPHLGLFLDAVGPTGSVVGLDQDAAAIEVARELWADAITTDRLRLQPGDLMALPFPDASFDLAWTSLALHHVADPSVALRELRRVVAPGGQVVVLDADASDGFPFLPWPPDLEERVRAALFRGAADGYAGKIDYVYHPYLGRSLPRLLREAGLVDVRIQALVDVDQAPLPPRRAAEWRAWFRGWLDGRLLDYLAPTDREAVLALIEEGSPTDLLTSPDFFLCRTWLLAIGRVDAPARPSP
jgi:ubiquinone/menaquinone biosynthesis C-methylase UbiE